ncbi:doublesex- and mab-3-related transcription factor C1-like [Ursus americanus]|uniref:doublesex- and mab-3-related transcription factor C1-like n=1 Tax=Ursus americanus TaxID=9643 RepID=UPI001E679CD8|nr:doublesex- and mab-3-related transcription factor C1-like [Ursus americanus]
MDPNEMPAVPCCPSDSPTGLETGAPWGIELGPKKAVSRCARCYNHGFADQIKDQEHSCLFQACECHKCAFFSEHHSVLPAESALKRKQGAPLKKRLAQGLKKSEASPPKAHSPVKKLTVQAGALKQTHTHLLPMAGLVPDSTLCSLLPQASAQGALLTGQAPKSLSLSWTPAALKMRLTISLSRKTRRTPALPSTCSALQLCAVLGPVLLQPQIPEASDQDSVSASEWQRKLEAAEALLILRESPQAPSGSISLLQPCVAAAPAGDGGPQPSSPSLRPRPASSISLPIGHLGCISLLS